MDLYVDKVFRTLLAVRGQPLGGQSMIAGTVAGPAGRPHRKRSANDGVGVTPQSESGGQLRFGEVTSRGSGCHRGR